MRNGTYVTYVTYGTNENGTRPWKPLAVAFLWPAPSWTRGRSLRAPNPTSPGVVARRPLLRPLCPLEIVAFWLPAVPSKSSLGGVASRPLLGPLRPLKPLYPPRYRP